MGARMESLLVTPISESKSPCRVQVSGDARGAPCVGLMNTRRPSAVRPARTRLMSSGCLRSRNNGPAKARMSCRPI